MAFIKKNNLIIQIRYQNTDRDYLNGLYIIASRNRSIPRKYLELFCPSFTISPYAISSKMIARTPNIVGYLRTVNRSEYALYAIPQYLMTRFYAVHETPSTSHLFLFEYSHSERYLDMTIVYNGGQKVLMEKYLNAWNNGELDKKIKALKTNIIKSEWRVLYENA